MTDSTDDTDDVPDNGSYDVELNDIGTRKGALFMAGIGSVQVQALQHGDLETVEECGELLESLVDDNPAFVRRTILDNPDAIRGQMPGETLDRLDLEKGDDGRFKPAADPDGDWDWVSVDVE